VTLVRGLLLALLPLLLTGPASSAPGNLEATVARVVDGDTIVVRVYGRLEKVRYIGVNTPEVHHPTKGEEPGGREASEVNRRLVQGKQVRLELDVRERDRYGRLLAYVWVGDTMINAELVRLGYAQVMTIPPNVRYQHLFLKLQREAREGGRGLWAAVPVGTR
jgi:micrococcal nuclease